MCATTKNRTIPTIILARGLADLALQPCTEILLLVADLLNSIILVVVLGVCLLHRLCSFLLECVSQQESVERPGRSARSDEALHRLHARCSAGAENQYIDAHLWAMSGCGPLRLSR
jgi:hypothetical protein